MKIDPTLLITLKARVLEKESLSSLAREIGVSPVALRQEMLKDPVFAEAYAAYRAEQQRLADLGDPSARRAPVARPPEYWREKTRVDANGVEHKVVQRVLNGESASAVARAVGMPQPVLWGWVQRAKGAPPAKRSAEALRARAR